MQSSFLFNVPNKFNSSFDFFLKRFKILDMKLFVILLIFTRLNQGM